MHVVVDACWIDTGYYCEFEQKPFPSHRFILFIDLIYIYIYIFIFNRVYIGLERIPSIRADDRKKRYSRI